MAGWLTVFLHSDVFALSRRAGHAPQLAPGPTVHAVRPDNNVAFVDIPVSRPNLHAG